MDVLLSFTGSFYWASVFVFLVIGFASVVPMGASEAIGWALFQSPNWCGFLRYGFVGLWDFPNLVYLALGAVAYFTQDVWYDLMRRVLGTVRLLPVVSISLSMLACIHALVSSLPIQVVTGLAFQTLLVYMLPVLLLECDARSLRHALVAISAMLSLVCIASPTFEEALLILAVINLLTGLVDGILGVRRGCGSEKDGAESGNAPHLMPATSERKTRISFQFSCACLLLACAVTGYAVACSDTIQHVVPTGPFSNGAYYLLPRFILMGVAILVLPRGHGQREGARGRRDALLGCLTAAPLVVAFFQAGKMAACGYLWILGSAVLVMIVAVRRCRQLFGAREGARLVLMLPIAFAVGAVAVSGVPTWHLMHPIPSFAMLLIHALPSGLVLRNLRASLSNLLEREGSFESRLEALGLAPRERDAVRALMNGREQCDVANDMGVAPSTASTYIRRSCIKMGVEGAGELRDRAQEIANSVQTQGTRPSLLHVSSSYIDRLVPGLTDCLIEKCGIILLCSCACAGAALHGMEGEIQSLSVFENAVGVGHPWLDMLRMSQVASSFLFVVIIFIDAALFFMLSCKTAVRVVIAMGMSYLFGHSVWKIMAQVGNLLGSLPISSIYLAGILISVTGALCATCLLKRVHRLIRLDEGDVFQIVRSETSCTPAEMEVAICMLRGASILETAEQLFISRQTVATHRKHLYAKLDAHSRDEMVCNIRKCILDWSKKPK